MDKLFYMEHPAGKWESFTPVPYVHRTVRIASRCKFSFAGVFLQPALACFELS